MARYAKGSIGNNWQKREDGDETPAGTPQSLPYLVLCWSSEGSCLNALSYRSDEEELARLAFDMNKAALTSNPKLLPAGTTQVVIKQGNAILDFAVREDVDLELIQIAS